MDSESRRTRTWRGRRGTGVFLAAAVGVALVACFGVDDKYPCSRDADCLWPPGTKCDLVVGVCGDATSQLWATWPMPSPASAGLPNPAGYDVNQGAGEVRDNVTGLTWQRTPARDTKSFRDALSSCNRGWRVPTRVELVSLLDYTQAGALIDSTAFPNTPPEAFWSSSHVSSTSVWSVDFGTGDTALTGNAGARVRCVK